ncbi:MAG: 2-oxoglutarate dehydrogenase E1 component [Candidatus Dadabacteria bacterium RIFCSPHIGHO2_12_FULL_53_21]|nr:MAG: 2-oxoglutarate dehydrogenase E1 component [Candidatus Dadabacteria bacterium RIFCSPHIGHO2_12_FULL_53_21]
MDISHIFHGPNSGYVLELYERYLRDPDSVDSSTRAIFDKMRPEMYEEKPAEITQHDIDKIVATANLAQAIRAFGHLDADIDPLGSPPPGDPSLELATHGLTPEDLAELPSSLIGRPISDKTDNAYDAIGELRKIYSSKVGYDYYHINSLEERKWLREAAETGRFRPPVDPINEKLLLENLTKVEVLEKFLHRIFPGKFRFSIEGVDMLIPILNEIVGIAAETGIRHIFMGMAHRGRLNVMHHVMTKSYKGSLIKFKDPILEKDFRDYMGWTGDVKYHEGARHAIKNGREIEMQISLSPNPSHLESVNPVVEGMARAAGTSVNGSGEPKFDPDVSFPIIVHGDAAFPGQGIVAETLNMCRLPGYTTGGTIHVITNNQLGYTALPNESRSTLYASDLAKGFEIPIVHVNADDPEACVECARLAFAYLNKFGKDFLIDLVGYRRHGHNEADEPAFTQPEMYKVIDDHPTVREIWAETLAERNMIDKDEADEIVNKYNEILHSDFESLTPQDIPEEALSVIPPAGAAQKTITSVPAETLREMNASLLKFPEGFTINPKLRRGRERREIALANIDEKTVDWAMAEELAFASILADGTSIRFTGQDSERGTFSHRHAVLHDFNTGQTYAPLQHIPQSKAAFEILNSPLTENACIGFEYGYNIQAPDRLVIWEAQYGDFINGAQTIIDEYVVSARAKWGQTPSLVLLLPHAYEGQGPDHSSGRMGRFLDSAAEVNMRIANCTTSAQYFHLLRRQAGVLEIDPLPLIVMTPKSLLRNPLIFSSLRDLSEGTWRPFIDDEMSDRQAKSVKRLILCSGKVYIDLIASELRKQHAKDIAIARLEQLYPVPTTLIQKALSRYPKLKEVVWLQEEPENMGAWMFIYPFLRKFIKGSVPLHFIGRRRNSSPAEGTASMHKVNQEALIKQVFMIGKQLPNIDELGITWVKNV